MVNLQRAAPELGISIRRAWTTCVSALLMPIRARWKSSALQQAADFALFKALKPYISWDKVSRSARFIGAVSGAQVLLHTPVDI